MTTTRIDASLWREQRQLADATHDLLDLGDRLGAYRNRVDVLPPGDAGTRWGCSTRRGRNGIQPPRAGQSGGASHSLA